MEVVVKKGGKEHLSSILDLIKELAVYEKEPDAVIIDEKNLERYGFGEEKIFDFFVAEVGGTVVGTAIYYYRYSTWEGRSIYLEDLIVSEPYRGKGIGDLLFKALIQKAKELKVNRLEWQVLNWNTPAINFYKKYNAGLDDEWVNGRLTYEQLQSF